MCGMRATATPRTQVTLPQEMLAYRGDVVPNARLFHQDDVALLHHFCSSDIADTEVAGHWTPGGWWACLEPERALDEKAHFDLNCASCAARWTAELQRA